MVALSIIADAQFNLAIEDPIDIPSDFEFSEMKAIPEVEPPSMTSLPTPESNGSKANGDGRDVAISCLIFRL